MSLQLLGLAVRPVSSQILFVPRQGSVRSARTPFGFVERVVDELAAPDSVKQHGELSGHRCDRLLLRGSSTSRHEPQSESAKVTVLAKMAEDVMRALDEESSQVAVPGLADPKLRITVARGMASRT